MNTPHGWMMFGFGMTAMIVIEILALALLSWHWAAAKTKDDGAPLAAVTTVGSGKDRVFGEFFDSRKAGVTDAERDRMTIGRWPIEKHVFVFVSTGARNYPPGRRRLITLAEAEAMAFAQYRDANDARAHVKSLMEGGCGCFSVAGGMIERPRKLGEAGGDSVSAMRNHPELADDLNYIRQCLHDQPLGEDYAARTGRMPELFAFRTQPASHGRLLTRAQADQMASQHYPGHTAGSIIAGLARGACSVVVVDGGTIERMAPDVAGMTNPQIASRGEDDRV